MMKASEVGPGASQTSSSPTHAATWGFPEPLAERQTHVVPQSCMLGVEVLLQLGSKPVLPDSFSSKSTLSR